MITKPKGSRAGTEDMSRNVSGGRIAPRKNVIFVTFCEDSILLNDLKTCRVAEVGQMDPSIISMPVNAPVNVPFS